MAVRSGAGNYRSRRASWRRACRLFRLHAECSRHHGSVDCRVAGNCGGGNTGSASHATGAEGRSGSSHGSGEETLSAGRGRLIAELIRRDLPFYDATIKPTAVSGMSDFARSLGILDRPLAYEEGGGYPVRAAVDGGGRVMKRRPIHKSSTRRLLFAREQHGVN